MKRTLTELILDKLEEGVVGSIELVEMMLASRPESYRRARNLNWETRPFTPTLSAAYRKKRNLHKLLSKLKSDGLISTKNTETGSVWLIKPRGKKRLAKIKSKSKYSECAENSKTGSVIIVSYDIPESLSKKRAWLREILKILGFSMIHKSVWVGKTLIPKDFLKDLSDKNLIDYVQIFEVTKHGTLSKLN